MPTRRVIRNMTAGSILGLGFVACAVGGAPDYEGESSDAHDDAIVSERQLMGTGMANGSFSLTFDDGPSERTAELGDYLASQGIRATFFVVGKSARARPSVVSRLVSQGHLVANHTDKHSKLTALSGSSLVRAISDCDDTIAPYVTQGPWLIRAPYGAWNGNVARTLNQSTMSKYVGSVFWDVGGELTSSSAADWACWGQGVSVERCGELYLREMQTRKRGIVLMHDSHSKTVDMVKQIVPTMLARGYKFERLDDVPSVKTALAAGPESGESCYSATLGKNVSAGTCVQSSRDKKWYRCADGDWVGTTSSDPACSADGGTPPPPPATFVGSACTDNANCSFQSGGATGSCLATKTSGATVVSGFCTLPCAGTCPDKSGFAQTFCVSLDGGATGRCVSKSSSLNDYCADVPGTTARAMSRHVGSSSASSATATVCVP